MALIAREAALIAASKLTTQRVSDVADDYETWLNSKITLQTAINALLESSGKSKSPTAVLVFAAAAYAAEENDPTTITSITRTGGAAAGAQAGGTILSIVGTNFTGSTGVTFAGGAGTTFVLVDDTHITITTPAHAAGAVNVVVVNPVSGNATSTNGYTYV